MNWVTVRRIMRIAYVAVAAATIAGRGQLFWGPSRAGTALASGLGASVRLKQAFCAAARAVPNTPIASWEEKHAMGKLRKIQMVGWARGRRRISAPVAILAIAVAAVTTVAVTGAFTGA